MTTKTIIAIGKGAGDRALQLTAVQLRHPLLGCPAVAQQLDYYRENGRNVGLVLLFPDGHTASLSYEDIRELQTEEKEHA